METVITIQPFNERGNVENVKNSKVYFIAQKINNNEKLTREEKNFITRNVNENSYFMYAIPLLGVKFNFMPILKTFIVKQYGQIKEYPAIDKTSLRKMLYGKIEYIELLKN